MFAVGIAGAKAVGLSEAPFLGVLVRYGVTGWKAGRHALACALERRNLDLQLP